MAAGVDRRARRRSYTVQIGLKELLGTEVSQIPVSLAGAVIAFVPLVILLLDLPEAARAQPHRRVPSSRPWPHPSRALRVLGNEHADLSPLPTRRGRAVRHDAHAAPRRPPRSAAAPRRRGQPARAATSRRWPTTRAWSASPSGSPPRQANLPTLQAITNAFNSSQSKVHVTLVTQAGYDDTWQKYLAGLSNGQLPDAVQLEDQRTQAAIDTNSFLPVQSCMNAAKYSTSDYLPRPLAYWKVNGVQWALPFAVSAPIVYYNENAFTKAGLNPADPPATLPQMLADAKALKASGSGMGLVLDPWHLETWLATANQLFVNNNNGRSAGPPRGCSTRRPPCPSSASSTHAGAVGRRHDQPVDGAGRVRQPARHGERQVRHDDRDVGRAGHGDPAARGRQVRQREAGRRRLSRSTARRSKGGIEPGGSGVYISNKGPASTRRRRGSTCPTSCNTQSQATWAAGHRLHPGPQVLGADGDGPAPVGHQPRLQGGLQRDQQRRQHAGHLRLGHRSLRRRAHRRAQRRDLHVHPGRVARRRRQGGERDQTISNYNSRLGRG